MNRKTIALVHYPVLDKNQKLYTTAITNIDIHDIARSACTYNFDSYYLISPIQAQRDLAQHIAEFWVSGTGHRRNPDRAQALSLISIQESIKNCIDQEKKISGQKPVLIATSAKKVPRKTISYSDGHKIINQAASSIVLLGTGYGLAPEIINFADYVLEPICGAGNYNHLSVRSAAAIMIDRLSRS